MPPINVRILESRSKNYSVQSYLAEIGCHRRKNPRWCVQSQFHNCELHIQNALKILLPQCAISGSK